MPAHPEHALQVQINKWVRECVVDPHLFQSFDRAKRSAVYTLVRQKARGLIAGTPDTCLLVLGVSKSIWIELKAAGERVKEDENDPQWRVGMAIIRAGHVWNWANSVEGYAAILARHGVRLSSDAQARAQGADRTLAGFAERAGKPRKTATAKKAEPKATAAKLARVRGLYARNVRL